MMNEIAAEDHIGFLWSMLVVYGVGGLFLGTLLWLTTAKMLRLLSRARLARRIAILETKPLEEGPAVLRGTVELDEDDSRTDAPVRLVVFQEGTEYSGKNGTTHIWTETKREISYRPFYLRLPSQERLRIVPNARTMLADGLDGLEFAEQDKTHRARVAELSVGEEVIASGVLKREKTLSGEGGGYRGGGTTMVMRAPITEKLLLSTSPLAERFEQSANHYRICAIVLAAFALFSHTFVFGDFHRLNTSGVVVRGIFVNPTTYETNNKGNIHTHFRISAAGPNGEELSSDVDAALYQQAHSWVSVPFVLVPSNPKIHTIGTEPRTKVGNVIFFLFAIVAGVFAYRFAPMVQSRLPWYERRKIVDSGKGNL